MQARREKGRKSPVPTRPSLSRQRFRKNLGFFRPYVLFNGHVFELAGFKNVATFLAFNKFSVFFARDDSHAGMLAGFLHRYWFGRPLRNRWVLGDRKSV